MSSRAPEYAENTLAADALELAPFAEDMSEIRDALR